MPHVVRVVAAVLYDASGRVLIAQRPAGKHMAGRWEFPGGKIDAGETERAALVRELAEELGIVVIAAERLLELSHDYADRRVELCTWRVTRYDGVPHGRDGQTLKWVHPLALGDEDLLEADGPIVAAVQSATPAP